MMTDDKYANIRRLLLMEITWIPAAGKARWTAVVGGREYILQMNDFPEEPLYTLSGHGDSVDMDDAPRNWIIVGE